MAKPALKRLRTSTISALYQDSPSLLFSSMVENAVFGRGVPFGMNTVPSVSVVGGAVLMSLLRSRCFPREPAYPTITDVFCQNSSWTFMLKTWTRGVSRSHCTGRIEIAPARVKSGVGNVGLTMTGRGVAGGLVTVTIRFWWLLVLK